MMYDFSYNHPINVHFGKTALNHLAEEVQKAGSKVMLVYGGGSIKRNGVYDQITGALKEAGIDWVDFGGNVKPWYAEVLKAVDIAKREKVDCVIGIGGSTCMDMAKVIAYGAVITLMQISLNYFTGDSPISERLIEGLIDTIRDSVKIAIADPKNYEARANQALASIYGTNAIPSLGKSREWVYNVYDYIGIIRRQLGISYRETFSIIFPYWLQAEAEYHGEEIKNYMVKIWGVDANLPEKEACAEGAKRIIAFYESLGLPMKYNLVAKKPMPSREELIKATEAEYYSNMMPMEKIVAMYESCMDL